MRKIRHLSNCEFVIPVNRASPGLVALSNQFNCYLERPWHQGADRPICTELHARFNSSTMNGIEILARLHKNDKTVSSMISSAKLYVLSDSGFVKTFVSNVTLTASGNNFYGTVSQATLALNELSGRETYQIEVQFSRVRKKYKASKYFNHLGCFDSLNRLRQATELLQIVKVDE